jgi:hypothetical protein
VVHHRLQARHEIVAIAAKSFRKLLYPRVKTNWCFRENTGPPWEQSLSSYGFRGFDLVEIAAFYTAAEDLIVEK